MFTEIPTLLKNLPNWIVWRMETRTNKDGTSKATKVPYNAMTGTYARSNDPATWSSFDDAVKVSANYSGIGFCFPLDRTVFGVDFDAANAKTEAIINRLNTYVEVSPSGRGYHAICLNGKGLDITQQKWDEKTYGVNVEIYNSNARYFTFTGNAVKTLAVADCNSTLTQIVSELKPLPSPWEDIGDPVENARRAIKKIVPNHQENDGSQRLLNWVRQCAKADLSATDTIKLIREEETLIPFPKYWTDSDIEKRLDQAVAYVGHQQPVQQHQPTEPDEPAPRSFRVMSIDKMMAETPALRPIIINDLLRRGEIANIVAAPKTGKSWAELNLAIGIARGTSWFGHACEKGRVLILDNELHQETLSYRIKRCLDAQGLTAADVKDSIDAVCLRSQGKLPDLLELRAFFASIAPQTYSIVIIDSLYRTIPRDFEENSNSDQTRLYNLLDEYAQKIDSAFIIIPHTSKGVQGNKGVTDVGAGAGAQSRAADTHIILRPHATWTPENKVLVMDAVVRSFPPVVASCWKFDITGFDEQLGLDATELLKESGRTKAEKPKDEPMTAETFAANYVTQTPRVMDTIAEKAKADGISGREATRLMRIAVDTGLVILTDGCKKKPSTYSRGDSPF